MNYTPPSLASMMNRPSRVGGFGHSFRIDLCLDFAQPDRRYLIHADRLRIEEQVTEACDGWPAPIVALVCAELSKRMNHAHA